MRQQHAAINKQISLHKKFRLPHFNSIELSLIVNRIPCFEMDSGNYVAPITFAVATVLATMGGLYKLKRSDEKIARQKRRIRMASKIGIGIFNQKDATADDSDSEEEGSVYGKEFEEDPWRFETEETKSWYNENIQDDPARKALIDMEAELFKYQSRRRTKFSFLQTM